MGNQREAFARLLVRALYYVTDGQSRWWVLPTDLNDVTSEAVALAIDRGWMLVSGDSICLTDSGRDLIKKGET